MENDQYVTEEQPSAVDQPVSLDQTAAPVDAILKPKRARLFMLWGLVLLAFISLVAAIVLHARKLPKQSVNNQTAKVQQIDLNNISSPANPFKIDNSDKVVINGQLQANQGLVITPTTQPVAAVFGQIYVDSSTGQLRYYDGKNFQTVQTSAGTLTNNDVLNLINANKLVLPQSIATTATPTFSGLNFIGSGNGNTLTIQASPTTDNVTFTFPANSGAAGQCLETDGTGVLSFANCVNGSSNPFIQGGNSFGATAVLGTTDNNSLAFETNGVTRATIDSTGNILFQNSSNAVNAFQVQNNANSVVLGVDTTNGRVGIDNSAPQNKLSVNTPYNTNDASAAALISTGAAGNKGLVVQAYPAQSSNLFEVQNSNASPIFSVGPSGDTTITSADNSSTAFVVQNSTNTSVLTVDTQNHRVGVNIAAPQFPLDVVGNVHIDSSSALIIGGTTVCNASGCGAQVGNPNYIQNGFTIQSNANFAIQSTDATAIGGQIRGKSGQSADLFQLQVSNGTPVVKVSSTGNTTIQPSVDSTTAFQIQNSAGNSNLFIADTQNGEVGIGTVPGYKLDVNGNVNIGAAYALKIGGSTICTISGCIGGGGSGPASVYNTTESTLQTNANFAIQTGDTTQITGVLRALSGQTADILQVQDSSANPIFEISHSGAITVKNSTDSTSALVVKDAAADNIFVVDTTNKRVGVNEFPSQFPLDVNGDVNLDNSGSYRINGNVICSLSGCSASSGSGNYIQNNAQTVQTAANIYIQSASPSYVTGRFLAAGGQTADVLEAQNSSGTQSLFSIGDDGIATFQNTNDSTGAFIVADSSGDTVLNVDTQNQQVEAVSVNTNALVGVTANSSSYGVVGEGLAVGNVGGGVEGLGYGSGIGVNGSSMQNASGFFQTSNTTNTNSIATLITKAAASQTTANLFEAQNTAGYDVFGVSTTGVIGSGNLASGNTGAVALTSGNATSGNSGNVSIDSGTASGTTGTVSLGTANTRSITIGNNNTANTVTIEAGTAANAIQIGNGATAHGIQIGTGAAVQTVVVGSTNTTSATSIQGGTSGAINIGSVGSSTLSSAVHIQDTNNAAGTQSTIIGNSNNAANTVTIESGTAANAIQIGNGATAHGIQIGTGAAIQTVAIGSTNTSSSTSIQGGIGGINIGTGAAAIPIQIGTTSVNTGNIQTIGIGNTTAAGTTNITIGAFTGATGGTTTLQAFTTLALQTAVGGSTAIGGTAPGSVAGNGTAASTVLTVTGPAGGATSGTTGQTGGTGSGISLSAGAGGASTGGSGANTGGHGGNITLTAGSAGAVTSGTNGSGGNIVLQGGALGTGGTNGTAGGVIVEDLTSSTTAFQIQNASGVATLTSDTTAQGANLVTTCSGCSAAKDSTFEAGSTDWLVKGSSTTVANSISQAYAGSDSLKVVTSAAAGDGAYLPTSTLQANTSYVLSMYLKSDVGDNVATATGCPSSAANTTLCDIVLGFQNTNGGSANDTGGSGNLPAYCITASNGGLENVIYGSGAAGWQQFICTFTTGATVSSPNIYVKDTAGVAQTFYVDQVELYNNTGAKITLGNSNGASSIGGDLTFVSGGIYGGGTITLQAAPSIAPGTNYILTLPSQSGTICTDNPNSNCSITGDAKYLFKNSPDTSTVNSSTAQYKFTNNGAGSVLQLAGSSTNAFQVQNAASSQTIFNADTSDNLVTVGQYWVPGITLAAGPNQGGSLSGGTIYYYKVTSVVGGQESASVEKVFNGANFTSLVPASAPTSTGATSGGTLTASKNYWYVISYTTANGTSVWSPISAQISTTASNKTIPLTWSALPSGVTNVNVYRSAPSGTHAAITDFSLINAGGCSSLGAVTSCNDSALGTGSTNPISSGGTAQTNLNNLTISFTAAAGATYNIYRSTTSGSEQLCSSISGGSTSPVTDMGAACSGTTPPTNVSTNLLVNGKLGIGTPSPTGDITFGSGADRTINVLAQQALNGNGNALTISSGQENGNGTSGTLTLQGANALAFSNGTGGQVNINGGNSGTFGVGGGVALTAGNSNSFNFSGPCDSGYALTGGSLNLAGAGQQISYDSTTYGGANDGGSVLLQAGTSCNIPSTLFIVGGGTSGAGTVNGGNIVLQGGNDIGGGTPGEVIIQPQSGNDGVALAVQNAAGNNILQVGTGATVSKISTSPDDGDFESGSSDWVCKGTCTSRAIVGTTFNTGSHSYKVVLPSGTANSGVELVAGSGVTLTSNTSYTMSVFIESDSADSAANAYGCTTSQTGTNPICDIVIGHNDTGTDSTDCSKTSKYAVSTTFDNLVGTSSLSQYVCSFTTGTITNGSSYIFIKRTGTEAETFYIDTVELYSATAGAGLQIGTTTPGAGILSRITFRSDDSLSSGGGAITLQATPSINSNYILTLPAESGTICTNALTSDCYNLFDSKYINKNTTDSSSAVVASGFLYGFTDSGSAAAGVLQLQNTSTSNTGTVLSVGDKNSNGTLLDLQLLNASGGATVSRFTVSGAGNITIGNSSSGVARTITVATPTLGITGTGLTISAGADASNNGGTITGYPGGSGGILTLNGGAPGNGNTGTWSLAGGNFASSGGTVNISGGDASGDLVGHSASGGSINLASGGAPGAQCYIFNPIGPSTNCGTSSPQTGASISITAASLSDYDPSGGGQVGTPGNITLQAGTAYGWTSQGVVENTPGTISLDSATNVSGGLAADTLSVTGTISANQISASSINLGIGNPTNGQNLITITGYSTTITGVTQGITSGNGLNAGPVLTVTGPAGEATNGISQTAGNGSAISLTAGAGGAATASSGTTLSGNGGNVTIAAGNGGNNSSSILGTAGSGGSITLQSGAAGTGGSGGQSVGGIILQTAAGGSINIGSNAVSNSVSIAAANGANSTGVTIGSGVTGSINTAQITIGSANAAASTTTIQGGNSSTAIQLLTSDAGSIVIGSATQTGSITVGQSTNGQTINIGTGITASTKTLAIHIGDAGASGSFTNITIGSSAGGSILINGTLNVADHITTSNVNAGTTTFTVGAASCGGANTGSTGDDTAGKIVIVTGGSSCSSGILMTVGFATSYGAAPSVVVTPGDATTAAAGLQYFVTPGTGNFTLNTANSTSSGPTYTFYYHVIQ